MCVTMENTGETAGNLEFIRWARGWSNPSSVRLPDGATFPEATQVLADNLASAIGELLSAGDFRTADLTRVELCREALATALQGEAIACRDRFSMSSDLRDIALTVFNRQASLDATVPETIEFAERQVDFALDLRARHTIDSSDKPALDRAIEMVTAAQTFLLSQDSIPTNAAPGSRQRSAPFRATEALADLLGERFEDRSDSLDLDRAIEVATVAHNLATGDRQATAVADNRLALLLRLRHDHRGDHTDLDLAITHAEASVSGTDPTDPYYPVRLGNLGLRLATRFNLSGIAADLDRSIDLARTGLSIGGVSPHERRRLLGNLAIRLRTRHNQGADPADLDASIDFEEEAMTLAAPGITQPLWLLNNLGISLSTRYSNRGDPADLDRSISLAEEALALSPLGNADRPSRLNNLSLVISTRYEHRGDPADLDRSIDLSAQAVAESPEGSPFLAMRQHNHGTHLAIRYDRQGDPSDLDLAIDLARSSVSGTLPESPERPARVANLSQRLGARFSGRGRREDLDEAINYAEEALADTPEAGLERSARVGNLAIALGQRWRRDGSPADRSDLDRAISLTETSLALMESGNPERATRLASLSGFLRWRHDQGSDRADLEAALQFAEDALSGTADGHPNRAARLASLASLLEVRGTPADQVRSIALHRDAWARVTETAGFAGFAVVGIGNGLASALRNLRSDQGSPVLTTQPKPSIGATDHEDADHPGNELLAVLSVTLDALDAYLARLPLDAEADALFAVGTYGHLYGWLIEETATVAQATIDAGLPANDLLRATFGAIERSKGRRLASRLHTGKLQPTAETQPLVDALERLKPELDRLETILFSGGASAPLLGTPISSRGGEPDLPTTTPVAFLGWLQERKRDALEGIRFTGSQETGGAEHGNLAEADFARLVARHRSLRADFSELLRQIERSDRSYATARGYAAPRPISEVASALPVNGVLVMFAPLETRTVAMVLANPFSKSTKSEENGNGEPATVDEPKLAMASVDISDAQWSSITEQALTTAADLGGTDPTALTQLTHDLERALRGISDRVIPVIAPLLEAATGREELLSRDREPASPHLVLVPTGAMHRLPLHALPWAPRGISRWDRETRLTDRYAVTYANMADVLPLVTSRKVVTDGIASLAPGLGLRVGDEAPHATVALAAALARVADERSSNGETMAQTVQRSTLRPGLRDTAMRSISRITGHVSLRVREDASRDAILTQACLAGKRFGFVATHGRAGGLIDSGLLVHSGRSMPDRPTTFLNEALTADRNQDAHPGDYSEGTWVTSAELLARMDLGGVDHLQLLACSTHADDPAPGDHLSGLLTSLLIRGTRSVGGTLWPVDEVAAVLVGWHIGSALILGETNKADALRVATRWLRNATPSEVAEVLTHLGKALMNVLPVNDPAHEAVQALASRFASLEFGDARPFAELAHWAPYVIHGAPCVGETIIV